MTNFARLTYIGNALLRQGLSGNDKAVATIDFEVEKAVEADDALASGSETEVAAWEAQAQVIIAMCSQ